MAINMFMSIKNVHVKMRKWRYKMFMSNQNVDVQFNLTPFTVTKMSKLTVTDVIWYLVSGNCNLVPDIWYL